MDMPDWALSIAYWVHLLATVAWIGGLAALALLVLPAAHRALQPEAYAAFLESVQKRMDPLGWLSLVLLVATGMFQMSANPLYDGFLAFTNSWAVAILLKHLVIAGMVGVSAYLTWGVLPQIRRAALRRAAGKDSPDAERLWRQEARLMRLNLALGVVVLALTAVARAAG